MVRDIVITTVALVMMSATAHAWYIKWDASVVTPPVTGVPQGYNIYRDTGGATCGALTGRAYTFYATVPAGQTEFTDTTPVIGANYYEVTAFNSGGESLPSNQVCFQSQTAQQEVRPAAPQNLRVVQ